MKVGKHTETLDMLLASSNGIISTSDVVNAGVPKDAFYRYVRSHNLKKQSHGVYSVQNGFPDEFALLQARFPKAIFSHASALYLHGMSESEPIPLSVSVKSNYNAPALKDLGVRIYYVKPLWHSLGICRVETLEGNIVRVYNKERTVCDAVRRRAHIDVTEFNHALKTYVASNDKNLARLSEYARVMNVESRLWDAIGVLL